MKYFKQNYPALTESVVKWNEIARDDPPEQSLQELIVKEEMDEWEDAPTSTDMLDAAADIFFTASYLEFIYPNSSLLKDCETIFEEALRFFGYATVMVAISEVIWSNYSKFIKITPEMNIDLIGEQQCEYIKKTYNIVVEAQEINGYLVFVDANKKVRKPSTYEQPKLEQLL